MSKIQKYKDRGFNLSISDVSFNRNVCLDCAEANARRVISHRKVDRSDRVKGKYWSCDTSGPYDPSIVKKNIYKTVFIELVTRMMISMYHQSNDERTVREIIVRFDEEMLGIVKAQGIIPIFLKSDNGVFKAEKIRVLCVQKGIVQKFTAPHHSSSNGDAERALGDTRFMAMRMLAHSNLSEALFWEQADQAAVYIHNRIPYSSDGEYQLPPIVQWEGSWPDYSIFRKWGCPAVVTRTDARKDFSKRGLRGHFVGYRGNTYIVYVPALHDFVETRNVRFDETVPLTPGINGYVPDEDTKTYTVNDFTYLVGTRHIDPDDGIEYTVKCVRQYRGQIVADRVLASDVANPRAAIDTVHALDIQSYYRSCESGGKAPSTLSETSHPAEACRIGKERPHAADELTDEKSSASCNLHSASSSRSSETSDSKSASQKRTPAHDEKSDSSREKRARSFAAKAGVRWSSRVASLAVLYHRGKGKFFLLYT